MQTARCKSLVFRGLYSVKDPAIPYRVWGLPPIVSSERGLRVNILGFGDGLGNMQPYQSYLWQDPGCD